MTFSPERKRKIYLDMDGVLVDMVSEYCRRYNVGIESFAGGSYIHGNDAFWQLFDTNPKGFFRDAPIFEGTRDFIEAVFVLADQFGYEVECLTAIPKKVLCPYAEREKNEWMMAQKFSRHVKVNIGPYAIDKQAHYKFGDLLIDDNDKNITQWIEKGGVGILHTSFEQSLEELKLALAISDGSARKYYS